MAGSEDGTRARRGLRITAAELQEALLAAETPLHAGLAMGKGGVIEA